MVDTANKTTAIVKNHFEKGIYSRIIGRWINLDKKNKNNNYSKYLNVTTKRLKKSLHYLQNQKLSNLYSKVMA